MPIYMKYEGIHGDAKGKYTGWIELQSFQIGGSNLTAARSGRENQFISANTNPEVDLSKYSDSATSALFNQTFNAKPAKVTIDFVESGKSVPYMTIELENAMISSFSVSGKRGDEITKPYENISINYTKINYTIKPNK